MFKRISLLSITLISLIALLLLISLPAAAVGPTIKWVDQTSGSDANDGNTEATAYATLQHALANTESGLSNAQRSFIYVKDGIYTGPGITNTCEGINGAVYVHNLDWLTIQAPAGHEPVITPPAGIVSLVVEGSDHLVVDNLDSDQSVALADNWHVCDSDDLTLRNSAFTGGDDGIDFHTALTAALIENNTFSGIVSGSGDEVLDFTDDFDYSGVTIQDNNFINNYRQITVNPGTGGSATDFRIQRNWMNGTTSQEAIRLINARDFRIFNNVILNSMQEGIYVDTGSTLIDIVHNTFFNNSQEAGATKYGEIRTNPTDAGITIFNNIIHGNGTNPPIVTSVASLPAEDYNLFYNYVLAGSFTTFGANSISGLDPLFANTTAGSEDLHLTATSPAIEMALSSPVSDDKDKGPRPNPAATDPDMGAYEFAPVTVGYCPSDHADVGYLMTDLIGTGQGTTARGQKTRRLVIPNHEDLAALYGQLAAVDVGQMKYVRFLPQGEPKIQIHAPTSPSLQRSGVAWWGSDLPTDSEWVKGQFFWGPKGNKAPRAFILWPTYETDEPYANVFVTLDDFNNYQVADAPGFNEQISGQFYIPTTQAAGATVEVRLAVVDNDKDDRETRLTVGLGTVSSGPYGTTTLIDTEPNARGNLNIYTVRFENVPAGADKVLYLLRALPGSGDSAALIGIAASYPCGITK